MIQTSDEKNERPHVAEAAKCPKAAANPALPFPPVPIPPVLTQTYAFHKDLEKTRPILPYLVQFTK